MESQIDVFTNCRQSIDMMCATLGLRPMFSLATLIAELESFRKRRIFLLETSNMPHSHTAMTISTLEYDVICYRAGFEAAHKRLTIAHELGHIIGNHPRREMPTEVFERYPELHTVARYGHIFICGRTVYEDRAEVEAEYMATYLTSLITPTNDGLISSILQL
jgi:hypothetical protein